MKTHRLIETPLGFMTAMAEGDALVALSFARAAAQQDDTPVLLETERWIFAYFAGETPAVTMKLHLRGTPFQEAIWSMLQEIPYGDTVTYGDLAQRYAREHDLPCMAAQAVGGAVHRNPIGLIVPCHRVVGAHRALTGYAAGLERKRALLQLECSRFFL